MILHPSGYSKRGDQDEYLMPIVTYTTLPSVNTYKNVTPPVAKERIVDWDWRAKTSTNIMSKPNMDWLITSGNTRLFYWGGYFNGNYLSLFTHPDATNMVGAEVRITWWVKP